MDIQRRAQAIATAPRRKRHDDDDDDTDEDQTKQSTNNSLSKNSCIFVLLFFLVAPLGYIKTFALSIPMSSETAHPHSLPQLESNSHLLPTVRIDPPARDDRGQFEFPLNRSPSAPISIRKIDCND